MRNRTTTQLITTMLCALLLPAGAWATVNHGDYIGTGVDFLQVSETTTTAGDPEPIWEAPTLSVTGDQLIFTPSSFISSCTSGGSDVTASDLTTTIESQPGVHIEVISLQEGGDTILSVFPPFGDPTTNASAALTGTVTVLEDTSGPIAPVVIPFSGTFTPSDTFSLPANFGASSWTGGIMVDVAAVVPNATKAELTLTNTLDSNCGSGASASIQKKTVSGPAVSLAVNPLECELELEKTCCVPQPVLPDLDICEGDVISLVMEYTGDKCSKSNNEQGKKSKCYGRRKLGEPADVHILRNSSTVSATPSSGIEIGDTVEFSSSTGTLPSRLKFKAVDSHWRRQYIKMDTSCNRALNCGDQFGAWKVTQLETTEGGLVDCNAPPPPPVCALPGDPVGTPCDAKLVDLVLEYNGRDCQHPLANPQGGWANSASSTTPSA